MYYTHLSITACIQLSCVARHQTRSWSKPSFSLVDCRSQQWTGVWSKAVLTMKVRIRYGVRIYHSYPAAEVYHIRLVFSQIHFHLHQSILHDKVAHSRSKPSFSWVGCFSCPSQPNWIWLKALSMGKARPGYGVYRGSLIARRFGVYNMDFWHTGPWTLPALECHASKIHLQSLLLHVSYIRLLVLLVCNLSATISACIMITQIQLMFVLLALQLTVILAQCVIL